MSTIPTDADLEMRLRAVPENVPVVRHALGGMAATRGADPSARGAIALAVTEAVTNVVVHAYPSDSATVGLVEVEALADDDGLVVTVRDRGSGLRQDAISPGLGLGMDLIMTLARTVEYSRHGGMTEVLMRFDLTGGEQAAA